MLRRIFLGAFGVAAIAAADDPIKLLVQGATDVELGPLLDALEGRQATQIAAWTFWEGRIRRNTSGSFSHGGWPN